MSLYFYDSIQGAALGSGAPAGFSVSFGSATVEPYSNAGAFPPHQWLSFEGQNIYASLNAFVNSATVWFAFKFDGFTPTGPIFQTFGYNVTNGQKIITSQIKFESDSTLSIYIAGSPNTMFFNSGTLVNPGPFVVQSGVWYFFQVAINMTVQAITNLLQATYTIFVDGLEICSSVQGTSNFFTKGSFISNSVGFDTVSWSQPNGSGDIGLSETYIGAYSTTIGFPGNLWTLVIDNPGSGYLGADSINVGSGDATIGFTLGVGGAIATLIPISPTWLGDSYTGASNLTLSATSGTGSGFSGHATLVPVPAIRAPQLAVESATQPIDARIRIPQLVVERSFKPTNAHIRIPQMVIELPFKLVASGWIVKEC